MQYKDLSLKIYIVTILFKILYCCVWAAKFASYLQEFACNGTIVEHPEYGEVIQLQGDQRANISEFLKRVGLARDDQIKVYCITIIKIIYH